MKKICKILLISVVFATIFAMKGFSLPPGRVYSEELIGSFNITTRDQFIEFSEMPPILLNILLSGMEMSFSEWMRGINNRTCESFFQFMYSSILRNTQELFSLSASEIASLPEEYRLVVNAYKEYFQILSAAYSE